MGPDIDPQIRLAAADADLDLDNGAPLPTASESTEQAETVHIKDFSLLIISSANRERMEQIISESASAAEAIERLKAEKLVDKDASIALTGNVSNVNLHGLSFKSLTIQADRLENLNLGGIKAAELVIEPQSSALAAVENLTLDGAKIGSARLAIKSDGARNSLNQATFDTLDVGESEFQNVKMLGIKVYREFTAASFDAPEAERREKVKNQFEGAFLTLDPKLLPKDLIAKFEGITSRADAAAVKNALMESGMSHDEALKAILASPDLVKYASNIQAHADNPALSTVKIEGLEALTVPSASVAGLLQRLEDLHGDERIKKAREYEARIQREAREAQSAGSK